MLLPLHLKISAGGGGLALFMIIFGFVIFPHVLKSQLKKSMTLSNKNDVRHMWAKMPFFIDFKVYIFNFTNHEEIQKGAIPIVKEIGPYFFEKWSKKVILGESEENDTITYRKQDTLLFRSDLSGHGLTGEEEIFMPNIFMITILTLTMREKPSAVAIIKKALDGIYDKPSTVFMKVKVMDILFRGVNINCDQNAFAPKAVCMDLKKSGADLLIFKPNNQFLFSILGRFNGTASPTVITVDRGLNNLNNVGKVVSINEKTVQEAWKDECNKIEGTDGTIFKPYLFEKDPIVTYAEAFCRPFRTQFVKKTQYQGVRTNRYVANVGDMPNDPKLQCMCDSPENCVKGLMDTSKCTKAPLYISMPHYFDADPKLLENVEGLSPDAEAHSIIIDFEPITGTPLKVQNRIMFSMKLIKCDKMEAFANLPDTIVPLFWVKEDLALSKDFINVLKKSLFTPKKIVKVTSWLFTVFGLLAAVGGIVYHLTKYESDTVKKVSPQMSAQSESSSKLNKDEPANIVI